ncbi:MAG: porin [Bacteroides sp.]|nr:porin [Bacteroides sp.]
MKTNIIAMIALLSVTVTAVAQTGKNSARFELGNGLDISLNNGEHRFNIGGFIQGHGGYRNEKDGEDESFFGIQNAFFGLRGSVLNNKFSFLLETNFADSNPLMDAWMAYNLKQYLTVSVGQKQTFTNNREMLFHEKNLSMPMRSIVSESFSRTGRELGIFLESNLQAGQVVFRPMVAITTGDGRNSFGSSSIDSDLGGLKYGGRLDILPLGNFAPGNDALAIDFAREEKPKLLVGVAWSYNDGASNAVGEGHGDFLMYDQEGNTKFPSLRKLTADILFKYRGFTLMGEYMNATATCLGGIYPQATGDIPLLPEEIANYLALGNGYNIQAGYFFKKGWGVDARFSKIKPEFTETAKSVLLETNEFGIGISKYFIDNRLMCQGYFSYQKRPNLEIANEKLNAELSVKVIF